MSVVVPFVFPEMNQRSAVQMLQTCISLLVPSNLLVYPKRQFRRSTPFPPMWVAPRNLAKARRGTRSHIQLPTHAFVMSICVFSIIQPQRLHWLHLCFNTSLGTFHHLQDQSCLAHRQPPWPPGKAPQAELSILLAGEDHDLSGAKNLVSGSWFR